MIIMTSPCKDQSECEDIQAEIDPIHDIIDYLVRCANISFLNSHVDEDKVRTKENIRAALKLYEQSPTHFLLQFGKYFSPNHLNYFDNIQHLKNNIHFQECISHLKLYHSKELTIKRVRNRRYKAMQKLQNSSDYFSDKQMMYRNPLLYEQLVGQYLTDEELKERDTIDRENNTFLNVILETVARNEMREKKNIQSMLEDLIFSNEEENETDNVPVQSTSRKEKRWGDFDEPDTEPSHIPEARIQSMINANERNLLREEFLQEMYSSFIDGNDTEFDYSTVDNNEEYDDLEQISRDAEDKYFDSEENDSNNLEEHMKLVNEYGQKKSNDSSCDPLDTFMSHIENKLKQ